MTPERRAAFTQEILAMHGTHYAFIALELANERAAEARQDRLAAIARAGKPRTSRVRRAIARVALVVARAADAEIARAPLPTT